MTRKNKFDEEEREWRIVTVNYRDEFIVKATSKARAESEGRILCYKRNIKFITCIPNEYRIKPKRKVLWSLDSQKSIVV